MVAASEGRIVTPRATGLLTGISTRTDAVPSLSHFDRLANPFTNLVHHVHGAHTGRICATNKMFVYSLTLI